MERFILILLQLLVVSLSTFLKIQTVPVKLQNILLT